MVRRVLVCLHMTPEVNNSTEVQIKNMQNNNKETSYSKFELPKHPLGSIK